MNLSQWPSSRESRNEARSGRISRSGNFSLGGRQFERLFKRDLNVALDLIDVLLQ